MLSIIPQTAKAYGVLAVSEGFNTVAAKSCWPPWPPVVVPRGPPWSPVVPHGPPWCPVASLDHF
eukprot:12334691-Heterocapsa_arctica.AAC.1